MSATKLFKSRISPCALLAAFLTGCATTGPVKKAEPVFYPDPPAQPRVQYLTGITSETDLGRHRSKWIQFIVGDGPPADPLMKPYGLAVHGGKIFACDTVDRSIAIFDLAGKRMTRWVPRGEAKFQLPNDLDFAADGKAYIADAGRGAVQVFDDARKKCGIIAEAGMKPASVVASSQHIFVADVGRHCVGVYDRSSLRKLFTIPREDDRPDARLFTPTNLALDREGQLYVSDTGAFHIQKYDRDGRWKQSFGSEGDAPGQFARPKGVAVDREGRVFAVDAASQVVQVFAPDGRLLMYFGGPDANGHELSLPAGIAIDYDNIAPFRSFIAPEFAVEFLVFVTSQYGDSKINVYGFGHMI